MITTIRKQLSTGLINKIFLLLVVLSLMGIFSLPIFFKQENQQDWFIKVNNQTISSQAFYHEVAMQEQKINQLRSYYGQMADLFLNNIDSKQLVLNNLINQTLLEQLAMKLGLTIPVEYMYEKIQDQEFVKNHLSDVIPLYLFDTEGGINSAALKIFLQQKKMSSAQFLEAIRKRLIQQLVVELLSQSLFIPQFDSYALYKRQHSKKKFNILTLSYDNLLNQVKKDKVDTALLREFFEQENKKSLRYVIPEKRDALVWKFTPQLYITAINQADIAKYYEDNKEKKYIQEPAQVQIRIILYKNTSKKERPSLAELLKKLKDNASLFGHYAQQYSDDEQTASQEGLTHFFSRGTKEPALEVSAFTLSSPGDISSIIPLQEGAAIIQLVEKRKRIYKPLATVAQSIKVLLENSLFEKQFKNDIKGLLKFDTLDQIAFQDLIKSKNASVKEVSAISQSDKTPLAKALFSIKKIGNSAFYMDNNEGYVIQLKSIHKKYLPEFDLVKETIQDNWYHMQTEKTMTTLVQDIKEKLKTQTLESIAQNINEKVVTTDWLTRTNTGVLKDLSPSLTLQKIFQLENIGSKYIEKTEKDAYIIQLIDIQLDEKENSQKEQATFNEHLKEEYSQILVQSLIASLHRDATIEINQSFTISKEEYML